MSLFNGSRVVSDDTDYGIWVWYKPGGGTIAVDSSGDLTLVGGGVTTSIDVTTYSTFGKLKDYIDSIDGWHCMLVDCKRSDSADDTLLLTSTASIPPEGVGIHKDTSVALNLSIKITNCGLNQDDNSRANFIEQVVQKNTYGSGTSIIYVYAIQDNNANATEVLIGQWACAATTVEGTYPTYGVWRNFVAKNASILVQMIGSAACTGRLGVIGESKPLSSYFA